MTDNSKNAGRAERGGSAIGLILILAVIAWGVFVAIQYVPQHIEWITVSDVLEKVAEANRLERMSGPEAIWSVIDRQLYVDERGDLKEVFNVAPAADGGWTVSASYQRPLNLLFAQKQIRHSKTIELH